MNHDVLIAFVLDRSASMHPLVDSTVSGFNEFMDEQRGQEGQALLSLTLFNTNFEGRFVAAPLATVPRLGTPENPYTIGGNTALYDAVGGTVKGTETWLEKHTDFAGRVLVVILTDGEENASRQWHIHDNAPVDDAWDINNLIKYKQGQGWEFLFLGTGKASWLESTKFSAIPQAAVFNTVGDADSNAAQYGGLSRSMTHARSAGVAFAAAADAGMAHLRADGKDEEPLDPAVQSGEPNPRRGSRRSQ